MAWAFVGATSEAAGTANTSVTLTEPTGAAAGDLIVAAISTRSTATTGITLPSGWTLVGQQMTSSTATNTTAAASGMMAYIVRGSSAPSYTFTIPAGLSVEQGGVVAYRGNAATGVLDASTAVTAASATAVSVTGLTTTQADDLLVSAVFGGQEGGWSNFNNATTPIGASGVNPVTTAPSTTAWSERLDVNTTVGNDTSLAIADAVRTITGATGNLQATCSAQAVHVLIAGAFKIKPVSIADAWNANDLAGAQTLSNVDKTTTSTLSTAHIRSTQTYANETAGKYYAEFKIVVRTNSSNLGLHPLSSAINAFTNNASLALSGGLISVNNTSTGVSIGTIAANDIVGMAWNSGTERIWFRNNAGNWNNDAGADPATGTNGIDLSIMGAVSAALWYRAQVSGESCTVRTELAEYTQTVPSGFSSWMGETPATGNVTVNATGVAAGSALGTVTVDAVAPVSFEAVGVAAATALGTATATGRTNISTAAIGAAATALLGNVSVNTVWNVSATSVGMTAGTALGTATATGVASASITPTGQTAATALGNVSVAAGGAVETTPGTVAASAVTGTVTVTAMMAVSTTPTGVAATAVTGTVGVAGAAVATPASQTAATALGNVTVNTVQVASVTPIGVSATTALGGVSIAVGGGISITPSSLTAAAALGTATVAAQQQVSTLAAGASATALSGTASVSIRTSTAATGVAAAAVVGTATVTAKQAVSTAASGVTASTALGGVSAAAGGSIGVIAAGQSATALTGTATVTAKQFVSVAATGVAAATAVGVAVATGKTTATATGQFATALVGTVTVTTGAVAAPGVGVWNGSAWANKPVKVWNGAIWAVKPVKTWNGSAWI